jgi:hypothetical protein
VLQTWDRRAEAGERDGLRRVVRRDPSELVRRARDDYQLAGRADADAKPARVGHLEQRRGDRSIVRRDGNRRGETWKARVEREIEVSGGGDVHEGGARGRERKAYVYGRAQRPDAIAARLEIGEAGGSVHATLRGGAVTDRGKRDDDHARN